MEGLGNKPSHYNYKKCSPLYTSILISYGGDRDSDSPNVMLKRHRRPLGCSQPHTSTLCIDETTEDKGFTHDHAQSGGCGWVRPSLLTSSIVPLS